MWNLTKRECVRTLQAHEGFVRGMVVRYCGTSFFTVTAFPKIYETEFSVLALSSFFYVISESLMLIFFCVGW